MLPQYVKKIILALGLIILLSAGGITYNEFVIKAKSVLLPADEVDWSQLTDTVHQELTAEQLTKAKIVKDATPLVQSTKKELIAYSFKSDGFGWEGNIRTRSELNKSDIKVSSHHKSSKWQILNFKSFGHMGGTFECTFKLASLDVTLLIDFPGLNDAVYLKQKPVSGSQGKI